MKLKYIAILLATILLATVAAWAVNTYLIETTGYYEGNLEISPTSIDWGSMTQNMNVTQSVNITNHGNEATLTFLYIEPSGFNTTLICDADGDTIMKDQTIQANFTLTIHNGTAGTFRFDIEVVAEQT